MLQAQPGAEVGPSKDMVKRGRTFLSLIFEKRRIAKSEDFPVAKHGDGASLFHALVVIFLEYFAWGLLTVPVINVGCFSLLLHMHSQIILSFPHMKFNSLFQVLAETFPNNKFLMNGLILGVKVGFHDKFSQ